MVQVLVACCWSFAGHDIKVHSTVTICFFSMHAQHTSCLFAGAAGIPARQQEPGTPACLASSPSGVAEGSPTIIMDGQDTSAEGAFAANATATATAAASRSHSAPPAAAVQDDNDEQARIQAEWQGMLQTMLPLPPAIAVPGRPAVLATSSASTVAVATLVPKPSNTHVSSAQHKEVTDEQEAEEAEDPWMQEPIVVTSVGAHKLKGVQVRGGLLWATEGHQP
jgi:hypothetical protein